MRTSTSTYDGDWKKAGWPRLSSMAANPKRQAGFAQSRDALFQHTAVYMNSLEEYSGHYHAHPYGEIDCAVRIDLTAKPVAMHGWQVHRWYSAIILGTRRATECTDQVRSITGDLGQRRQQGTHIFHASTVLPAPFDPPVDPAVRGLQQETKNRLYERQMKLLIFCVRQVDYWSAVINHLLGVGDRKGIVELDVILLVRCFVNERI
jgi:hypothetical protein